MSESLDPINRKYRDLETILGEQLGISFNINFCYLPKFRINGIK